MRTPAKFHRLITMSGHGTRFSRFPEECPQKLRGIRYLGVSLVHPQQGMDRRLMTAPEQIPQGDIDPTQEMVGLEEVEALSPRQLMHASNISSIPQRLPQHRSRHRLAGTMGHGGPPCSHGHQRGSLAFPPTLRRCRSAHAQARRPNFHRRYPGSRAWPGRKSQRCRSGACVSEVTR